MTIIRHAVKRPISVFMILAALSIWGVYWLSSMGIDLLPEIYTPKLLVVTKANLSNINSMDDLVTSKIEEVISTINGVKNIESSTSENQSVVNIDFQWGTDIEEVFIILREKLDKLYTQLPENTTRPNIILADPSEIPILTFSVTNKSKGLNTLKNLTQLKEFSDAILKKRFEQLENVSRCDVIGGVEKVIKVEVIPENLKMFDINIDEINAVLKTANLNWNNTKQNLSNVNSIIVFTDNLMSTKEIGDLIIPETSTHRNLLIKDVCNVYNSFSQQEEITLFDNKNVLTLNLYKTPNSNTVKVIDEIKDVAKLLKISYPDYQLTVITDNSTFISNALQNVQMELIYGGIFAIIILIWFLKQARFVFSIAVAIPISFLLTICVMKFFNITFNLLSLSGMAIGVGLVLDNSIVVIDNIERYIKKGEGVIIAAIKGTEEVAMPIVASTLTTIVVFLPLLFLKGFVGELFRDQSLTLVFSLISSIFAALLILPLIISLPKFEIMNTNKQYLIVNKDNLKKGKIRFYIKLIITVIIESIKYIIKGVYKWIKLYVNPYLNKFYYVGDFSLNWMQTKYEKLLSWSLINIWKVISFSVVLIIVTVIALLNMKREFIPNENEAEFKMELTYNNIDNIYENYELTKNILDKLSGLKSIKHIYTQIGSSNLLNFEGVKETEINKTTLTIFLKDNSDYLAEKKHIGSLVSKNKNVNVKISPRETVYNNIFNPSQNDIDIEMKGLKFNDVLNIYGKLKDYLKSIYNNKIEVNSNFSVINATNIIVREDKLVQYNISKNQVLELLNKNIGSNIVGGIVDFEKEVNIILNPNLISDSSYKKLNSIKLKVNNLFIPINELFDIKQTVINNKIYNKNKKQVYSIFLKTELDKEEVIKNIDVYINRNYPNNISKYINIKNSNEEIEDSFSGLYLALLISILLMYMILASEFESLLYPFIILFSVPFGLVGGILFLYFMGASLNIISLMGLIILVGIADNDAVVKVEYILRKRKEGADIKTAIKEAGHNRFRPIVMNSLTVIFGLIPMIFSVGATSQLRVSLAIAIAGGLISSTILTLILIPILFLIIEKKFKVKNEN